MATMGRYFVFREQIFRSPRNLESIASQFRRGYVLSQSPNKFSKGERSGPLSANNQCSTHISSNFYTSTTLHTSALLPRQSRRNVFLGLMANIQSRTFGTGSAAFTKLTSESDGGAENNNNTEAESKQSPSKSITQRQRLAKVFAEYGTTAVVFHTCISLTSLGICYTIVSSGIDMVSILEKVGLGSDGLQGKLTSGASTFVVAYACHKVFMPVRIFLTVTCTPLIVQRLRAVGFLRMPAKKADP